MREKALKTSTLKPKALFQVEALSQEREAASKASISKEREVAEFCRSVDTGESVADEGRHLKLLNQVQNPKIHNPRTETLTAYPARIGPKP